MISNINGPVETIDNDVQSSAPMKDKRMNSSPRGSEAFVRSRLRITLRLIPRTTTRRPEAFQADQRASNVFHPMQ